MRSGLVRTPVRVELIDDSSTGVNDLAHQQFADLLDLSREPNDQPLDSQSRLMDLSRYIYGLTVMPLTFA